MDCTGSMASWIVRAKETLQQIIETIEQECAEGEDGNPITVRIAFVGYRDIKTRAGRFVVKSFTESVDDMKKYIETVTANGGEDAPEDVQGGLKIMLMEDWTKEASKKVFMITDAPPHGTHLHTMGAGSDHYPEGSPDGLIFEDLMKEFKDKNIDFNVIKLDESCDAMIKVMQECHDELDVKDMSAQVQQERNSSYRPAARSRVSEKRECYGMAMESGAMMSMKSGAEMCAMDEMDELADMMAESEGCDMAMEAAPVVDMKKDLACYMAKSSVATVSKNREMRMLEKLMAL